MFMLLLLLFFSQITLLNMNDLNSENKNVRISKVVSALSVCEGVTRSSCLSATGSSLSAGMVGGNFRSGTDTFGPKGGALVSANQDCR